MFFVRLILVMLTFGAGRSAVLAQQHGQNDWFAMIVALVALFALLVIWPRRRRMEVRK